MCRFVPLETIGRKSYAALCAMRCVGPHSTTSWVTMLRSAAPAQAHHSRMRRTAQPKQAAAASGLADAAGNKQKSILGFFAGFEPPAKAAESSALAGSGNNEALTGEQRASSSVQTHQQARSGKLSCHLLSQSVCSSMYVDRL